MKATDLIQHLASQIAKNGDRDVYLASRDADQYHLAHGSVLVLHRIDVRAHPVGRNGQSRAWR